MPTQNPRVSFMISKEQLEQIETFQHEHRIKSKSKAIVHLLNVGIAELENESNKVALGLSPKNMISSDLTEKMDAFLKGLSSAQCVLLAEIMEKILEPVKVKAEKKKKK